jgi:hypothetical protein
MDYAFVPGLSPYENLLRSVVQTRPNTTRLSGPDTIAGFLNELKSQSLKADNLVLGGHANDTSWVVDFDSVTPVPQRPSGTDYVVLQASPPSTLSKTTRFVRQRYDAGARLNGW